MDHKLERLEAENISNASGLKIRLAEQKQFSLAHSFIFDEVSPAGSSKHKDESGEYYSPFWS